MKKQTLVIHQNLILYKIFDEISDQINFLVVKSDEKKQILPNFYDKTNYLILTEKKILRLNNQIILNKFPISIFKLIEKINIFFLRLKFVEQSEIKIGKYKFNINSREMYGKNKRLKLTEKEINSIIYLFNSQKPIKIQELQQKVWGYQIKLDTHTVETHIYRLRKKILKVFQDQQFIQSNSGGYQII